MNESYTLTERLTALSGAEQEIAAVRRRAVEIAVGPHRGARVRERIVAELQRRFPALSHPQIGKLIGVEQSTVARIAARLRKAGRSG